MAPDFLAPLPTHYLTGHPINAEPGIWTVYRWDAHAGEWVGIMSSTIEADAQQFADECAAGGEMGIAANGAPPWSAVYIVREGE